MTIPNTNNRNKWQWFENTYWYCSANCMPAIQTQSSNTFTWVMDQTVWHITGYRDGYFWGVSSVLLTPMEEEPNPEEKSDSTFFASITLEGQVHITFAPSQSSVPTTTTGFGKITPHHGQPSFEMQVSSGPASNMLVHWAYMVKVEPGEPAWEYLPGTRTSVEYMVGGIEPPEPVAAPINQTE